MLCERFPVEVVVGIKTYLCVKGKKCQGMIDFFMRDALFRDICQSTGFFEACTFLS